MHDVSLMFKKLNKMAILFNEIDETTKLVIRESFTSAKRKVSTFVDYDKAIYWLLE